MREQDNVSKSPYTKWHCKYHIVFAPKYRRKVFYEEKRAEIREDITNIVSMEGGRNSRGRDMPRPHTFVGEYTTQNEDISKIWEHEICIPQPRILVQGILSRYCHISYRHRICPQIW